MYPLCLAHLDLAAMAGAFKDITEGVAVIVAGWWTYRRFIRVREDHSRIDATAGLHFIGTHDGAHLAVVTATVKNTGAVRHFIRDMRFDLRVLRDGHPVKFSEKALGQVSFPDRLYAEQRFFPESWVWSFVEPGVENTYRYTVALPLDARFVLVKVWVVLPGDDEFASSWRVLAVPNTLAIASGTPTESAP